jgi:hypothetical protein
MRRLFRFVARRCVGRSSLDFDPQPGHEPRSPQMARLAIAVLYGIVFLPFGITIGDTLGLFLRRRQ